MREVGTFFGMDAKTPHFKHLPICDDIIQTSTEDFALGFPRNICLK